MSSLVEVNMVNKERKRGERVEVAWYRTALSPVRLEFFLIIVYVTAAGEQVTRSRRAYEKARSEREEESSENGTGKIFWQLIEWICKVRRLEAHAYCLNTLNLYTTALQGSTEAWLNEVKKDCAKEGRESGSGNELRSREVEARVQG
ncbi:655_t:CDS:2 [Acaulospora colombiana]|uniref:655_t:CDS:1 n=1 Tax=Acaulospora colombiana TaxID=27376 RepID=A0ACA9M6B5_9GLOM|nr:655_t:CDS:2 [Acaulospora colombiana]